MKKLQYGRPKTRRLNLDEIEAWLPSIGFVPEKITQEWRHVIAFGAFEGKASVFKMACTQATAKHTHNERNWNEAVHLIDPKLRPHFTVPHIFGEGDRQRLYYFICDWYTSRPIARLQQFEPERVKHWLPIVAAANCEIEQLTFPLNCAFVTEHLTPVSKRLPPLQKLKLSVSEWASQVPRDLNPLVDFVSKVSEVRTAPAHGDFVLRQMFENGSRIGIIDGEHAGAGGLLHYDTAQMFVRLISDWNEWELAREYLQLFKSLLPAADQKRFWEDLKPVLIQRFVGDLWGSKNNPDNLDRLMPLTEMILKDKVI